ncbi:MAG: hypothetical protein JKY01_02605 [Pseudomonadales bacterium]|nr:hypothetical protein [Pseudomonadales bacterium]
MQSVTNQKVMFAQLQLDSCVAAFGGATNPRDELLAKGFADACTYQLMAAWRSLLQEIAVNYKVQNLPSLSCLGQRMVVDCIEVCEQQGLVAPELSYVLNLSKNRQSCLGRLLALFDIALTGAPIQDVLLEGAVAKKPESIINVKQLALSDSLQLQCQQLELILEELIVLIQHCRQGMQEY